MCRNQLGRRNITDEQKTILIGEAYKAQKMTAGGDRRSNGFSSDQNDHLKKYNNTSREHDDTGRFTSSRQNGDLRKEKKEQLDENHQIAKGDTRAAIAKSHNISQYEVQKAVEFGRGLDAAEKVSPGIKEAVLSGSVKESKKIFIFARLLRDSMGGVEVIYYPPPVCYDGVTTRDDIELMFGTDIESKAGPQTRERAGHT